MFIAIWKVWDEEVRTRAFSDEESLQDSAFNDASFPTETAVIHKLCDTTFEVVDTFKLRLAQV